MSNFPPVTRLIAAVSLVALSSSVLPNRLASQELRFTRITDGPVATLHASTGGVSWIDFDGDGDQDLFVANGYDVSGEVAVPQANWLFENRDGRFVLADTRLSQDSGFSSGSAWADFDNDGDVDVFVPNQRNQPNFLYRNDGNGVFVPINGPVTEGRRLSFSGTWADFDNDGLVDLFVSNGGLSGADRNEMFRNRGGGLFEPLLDIAPVADSAQTSGAAAVDVDDDGDVDLFVPGSGRASALYRNEGDWRFTRLTDVAMVAEEPLISGSQGTVWGDYDNDGDFDVYMGFVIGERDRIYRNDGGGRFTWISDAGPGLDGAYSVQPLWADLDNDADLDLVVATWGSPALVYLNDGAGAFRRTVLGDLGRVDSFGSSVAAADVDADGDLDLVIGHWPNHPGDGELNLFYRNDGPTGNWLTVDLEGTASNRSAIGARVEVTARVHGRVTRQVREIRSQEGWRSQSALTAHFGLGDADRVDTLLVRWPSGLVERYDTVVANQRVKLVEGDARQ